MNDEKKLEDLMYLLGEENTLRQFDSAPEDFTPSTFHGKMTSKKIIKRTFILIAAALFLSASAYAVNRYFKVSSSKDESTGTLTTKVESDSSVRNDINVYPGYIPEGYSEPSNAEKKFHLDGDVSKPGFSVGPDFNYSQKTDYFIGSEEYTKIGDVDAQIIKRKEGNDVQYTIRLFHKEDNQIIVMYAHNMPYDEIIKVAENIKYDIIPDKFVTVQKSNNNLETDNNNEYTDDYEVPSAPDDKQICSLNEKIRMDCRCNLDIDCEVNDIKVLDQLPDLPHNYFCDYNEYLSQLNPDGSAKPYKKLVEQKWEDDEIKDTFKDTKQKFVSVTLTLTNLNNKEKDSIFVCPSIGCFGHDDYKNLLNGFPQINNPLQTEPYPFYSDSSGKIDEAYNKDIWFSDFKSNEAKTIHLVYSVDEDYLNDAYIFIPYSPNVSERIITYSENDNSNHTPIRTKCIKVIN